MIIFIYQKNKNWGAVCSHANFSTHFFPSSGSVVPLLRYFRNTVRINSFINLSLYRSLAIIPLKRELKQKYIQQRERERRYWRVVPINPERSCRNKWKHSVDKTNKRTSVWEIRWDITRTKLQLFIIYFFILFINLIILILVPSILHNFPPFVIHSAINN